MPTHQHALINANQRGAPTSASRARNHRKEKTDAATCSEGQALPASSTAYIAAKRPPPPRGPTASDTDVGHRKKTASASKHIAEM